MWRLHAAAAFVVAVAGSRPSLPHPLVFFHIPKTGGTTLRRIMLEIFPGEPSIAPCHNLPCSYQEADLISSPRAINQTSCATLIAGHFRPGPLLRLLAEIDRTTTSACKRGWKLLDKPTANDLDNVDCIIAWREPISRMTSHYLHFRPRTDVEALVGDSFRRSMAGLDEQEVRRHRFTN